MSMGGAIQEERRSTLVTGGAHTLRMHPLAASLDPPLHSVKLINYSIVIVIVVPSFILDRHLQAVFTSKLCDKLFILLVKSKARYQRSQGPKG